MREPPTRAAGSRSTWTRRTATGCASTPPRSAARSTRRWSKLFDPEFMAEQDDTAAALAGGRSGAYDADRRIVELQADGIVADVIFPDGTQDNTTPFDASSGPGAKGCRLGTPDRRRVGVQPVARRLLRAAPGSSRRDRGDHRPRPRGDRAPGHMGEGARPARCAAPRWSGRAAVLQPPALRAALVGLRRPRNAAAHTCRLGRARLRRPPGCQRALRDGEPVLLAPSVLVPDLGRRLREPSGPHDGVRRAGLRLGTRLAPDDGQHVRPHVPARAGAAEVAAERVLASAVLRAVDVLPCQ